MKAQLSVVAAFAAIVIGAVNADDHQRGKASHDPEQRFGSSFNQSGGLMVDNGEQLQTDNLESTSQTGFPLEGQSKLAAENSSIGSVVLPGARGGMIVGGPLNGSIMPGTDGGMVVGGPLNGSILPGAKGGMVIGGPLNGTIMPGAEGGMVVGGPLNGTILPGAEGGMVVGGPLNGTIMPGAEGGMVVGGPLNGTIMPATQN